MSVFDDEEPEWDDAEVERSIICPACGVSTLPAELGVSAGSVCENPDCEAYGERVDD